MKYKSTAKGRWSQTLRQIIKQNKNNKNKKERILLVDGLNLFIRSFSAIPTTDQNGIHTGGLYGSLNSLKYAIKHLQPTRCVIAFDGKGGSVRRRKLYSDYKANRRGMKGLNRTIDWASEKEEEKSCKRQLQRFISYLKHLPVTSFTVDNIEADDAIAFICTDILDSDKCIIMSSDKDYLQLVNEGVKIWAPTKKKVYNSKLVKKEYGFSSQNILLWRTIEGDKSDNIPGVKGVSNKTLKEYFGNVLSQDKQLSIEEFLEHIDYVYEKNNSLKRIQKLYNNKDIIKRNYKLMQLRDVDISGTSKSQIINIVTNREIPTLNQTQLRKFFLQDKLYAQIKRFSSWYLAFQPLNSSAIRFNRKLKEKHSK